MGHLVRLPSHVLVPGDAVRLEAGDRVPADGTLMDARGVGGSLDSREAWAQLAKRTEPESCIARSRRMTHCLWDGRSHAFSDQQSNV